MKDWCVPDLQQQIFSVKEVKHKESREGMDVSLSLSGEGGMGKLLSLWGSIDSMGISPLGLVSHYSH